MEVSERSLKEIDDHDLCRLSSLAFEDLLGLYRRRPETARLYADSLMVLTLCQGAAEHYLRGKSGIKDFDVWDFFRAKSERPFPFRRRGKMDFGESKFGKHPNDATFSGRRVDVIGRSIEVRQGQDGPDAVKVWLSARRTPSARLIRMRPVIVIYPASLRGTLLWDPVS